MAGISTAAAGGVTPAAPEPKTTRSTESTMALLGEARSRFALIAEAESTLRTEQLDDKEFRASRQWPAHIEADRKRDRRPILTVNRLPQFIKQITNQARQNRPSIQINPVDDHADPDTAEVIQGIIRHIENASHASVAYDTAVEDQVTMGRGYIRLITDFEDERSFKQCIRIRRVRNAHQVYYDPGCVEPDYSDAMYAFEVEDLDEATFKAKHPKARLSSADDLSGVGDQKKYWLPNGSIRIADYFYVVIEDVDLVLLDTGDVFPKDEAEQKLAEYRDIYTRGIGAGHRMQPVPAVVDERTAQKRIVKWAKITGSEILEEGVWPGRWIPIIPVLGDEIVLGNGRVDYRGIVRDAKDQQRAYNYQVTSLVETIQLAPRAPWIVAEGQIEKYKRMWKEANTKNFAYLPYSPQTVGGNLAPAPQRQNFEPAIQAIVAAVQQADNDLKATTGFYDASLGERGPEQSGKAILARQKQGEIASSNYMDNLGRALWALGRQLLDLIPKIYDAPRILRIMGLDDQQMTVMIHAGQGDNVPEALPEAVKRVFDLSVGSYDVTIGSGHSADTRRQEAVEMMTEATRANPNLIGLIGDLYFGAMDWPMARQIAARLKKALPPEMQDEGDDKQIPPKVKAQVAQMNQMIAFLDAQLTEANEEIRTKRIENDGKREIELLKAEVQLVLKSIEMEQAKSERQAATAEKDRDRQFDAAKTRFQAVTQRDSEERQVTAGRETQTRQLKAGAADTVLQAELGRISGKADEARSDREREENHDHEREMVAAKAKQMSAGAGAKPAGGKRPTRK